MGGQTLQSTEVAEKLRVLMKPGENQIRDEKFPDDKLGKFKMRLKSN